MPRKKKLSAEELATKADQLKAVQTERLALSKQADELKKQEQVLMEELIDQFKDSSVQGITGRLCKIKLVQKTAPNVTDWDALWDHIAETGEFELLHKRLTVGAVAERWEEGVEVPGVESTTQFTLSITKP